ncbi:MAG TPA: DNA polymerase IV, partial [Dehalococcoidia bacterium]|nr:DNA polymerase IV [Dehalococcoidia bacterium]
ADAGQLERMLGSRGPILRDMARGIDERAVEPVRERKSIGAETTFAHDLPDGPELRRELAQLAEEVGRRLREKDARARTIVLKLRYSNFRTVTRRTTRSNATDDTTAITADALRLLGGIVEPGDRFRLVGVTCGQLMAAEDTAQLTLWPAE